MAGMTHAKLRSHFINSAIARLPSAHRPVFLLILDFLKQILTAEYGITADKLSRAFALVLFRAKIGAPNPGLRACEAALTVGLAFASDEAKKAFQAGCASVLETLVWHEYPVRFFSPTRFLLRASAHPIAGARRYLRRGRARVGRPAPSAHAEADGPRVQRRGPRRATRPSRTDL